MINPTLLIISFLLLIPFLIFSFALSNEKESENHEPSENWEEADLLYSMTTEEALKVIDDAECNGFEFKRVGTKLYFREM